MSKNEIEVKIIFVLNSADQVSIYIMVFPIAKNNLEKKNIPWNLIRVGLVSSFSCLRKNVDGSWVGVYVK